MEIIIKNHKVLYDKEDQDIVDKYKWYISDSGYAVWRGIENGKKKTIRLHRLIAKPTGNLVVDHINRNRLDNRRCNLRCVSQKENTNNSDRYINAKGYYYGNSKCRKNNKWILDYKGYSAAYFTEEEAKKAVEDIKNGSFEKPKILRHNICKKCGAHKQIYGGMWVCRNCVLNNCKNYYKRKRGKI